MFISTCVCICVHKYGDGERERERDRESGREGEDQINTKILVYIQDTLAVFGIWDHTIRNYIDIGLKDAVELARIHCPPGFRACVLGRRLAQAPPNPGASGIWILPTMGSMYFKCREGKCVGYTFKYT